MDESAPAARVRQWWRLIVGLAVVAAVVLLGLGYVAARGGSDLALDADRVDGPRSWIAGGLIVVGVAIELWGLVRATRRRRAEPRTRSSLADLSRRQRGLVRKRLRGRLPVDVETIPITRSLAENTIRDFDEAWPIGGGVLVVTVGQVLSRAMSFTELVMGACGVLVAVGLVVMYRDVKRSQAFLQRHPETEPRPQRT